MRKENYKKLVEKGNAPCCHRYLCVRILWRHVASERIKRSYK